MTIDVTIPSAGPQNGTAEVLAAINTVSTSGQPGRITVLRNMVLNPGTNLASANQPIEWVFGPKVEFFLETSATPADYGFVINGQPVVMRNAIFNASSAARICLFVQQTDISGCDQITAKNATFAGIVMAGLQGQAVGRFYVRYEGGHLSGVRHGVILDSCNHTRFESILVHVHSGHGIWVIGGYSDQPNEYLRPGFSRSSGGVHIRAADIESHQHSAANDTEKYARLYLDGCSGAIIESFAAEGTSNGIVLDNKADNNSLWRPRMLGVAGRPVNWLDIRHGSGNRVEAAIVSGIGSSWSKARIAAGYNCRRNRISGTIDTPNATPRIPVRFEQDQANAWECEHSGDDTFAASVPPAWVTEYESPVLSALFTGPRGWRRTGSTSWESYT